MNPFFMRYLAIVPSFVVMVAVSIAQPSHTPHSNRVRVTPGIEYQANGFHEFFAGAHWRDLWATEFEAEVLDLDSFAGGLTPTKMGGSLQTLNLRFIGNDGREYKFRSLNKDGKRTLPPELQESFVGDVYQDQISIGNPMAAVVVPPLLNALGVLNAEPRIVVMPASDRLKQFEKEFAGVLGTIEEHPKAGKENDPGFRGADNIVDGFEIFEALREDSDERIDAITYLKARLIDLLLGDRDRHADQYRWAGFERNGKREWQPIPRDRDFAFGRYDGVFPSAAGLFVHSAAGFGESYPSILELTWIGRHLDRRFLSSLDKPVWDSVTAYVKSAMTDSLMGYALRKMPKEMFDKGGAQMFSMLTSRRDKLNAAADEFYELVSDVVDVYGTDKAERVEIQCRGSESVEVRLLEKETGEPLFGRVFSNNVTSEIRIHLLGGDDVANVEGTCRSGILIRILADGKNDKLVTTSNVSGVVFSNNNASPTAERTQPNKESVEQALEDRYRIWRTLPLVNFNSDDGIILGGTTTMTKHAFRADPYAYSLSLDAQYAPRVNHYDAQFHADSYTMIEGARTELLVKAGNLLRTDFYGIGNETVFSDSLDNADFYETRYHAILVAPFINVPVSHSLMMKFGGMYEYANARVRPNSLLAQTKQYGLGIRSTLAVSAGLTYDGRDLPIAPTRGVYLHANGLFSPSVFNNNFEFGKFNGDLRAYIPATILTDVVFAFHAGGEKTFGTYPFYKASSIGGIGTLRGFARDRFAGDASLFGQVELRAGLGHVNLFIPGRLGVSFFGDAGRVFVKGERSQQWHSGFGGGLWLNTLNVFLLNISAAGSAEGVRFYVTSGFGF